MGIEEKKDLAKQAMLRWPGLALAAWVLYLVFSTGGPVAQQYMAQQHGLIVKLISECNIANP